MVDQASAKLQLRSPPALKKSRIIDVEDQCIWNEIGEFTVHVQSDYDVVLADRARKVRNMASEDAAGSRSEARVETEGGRL
jgi:hypothetical protein